MRAPGALVGVGLILVLSGCLTPSIHPLYTDEDLVFDPVLIRAAQTGHHKSALLLLEAGADPAARDNAGLTPLLWAARSGHRDIAETLLDEGADASAQDPSGLTPLLWAARNGHDAVVKLLGTGEKED